VENSTANRQATNELSDSSITSADKTGISEAYRTIMDEQRELICCFDPGFNLCYINRAFCHFYSIDKADINQSSLLDYIPLHFEELSIEINKLLQGEEEIHFHTTVIDNHGDNKCQWWNFQMINPSLIQASARVSKLIPENIEKMGFSQLMQFNKAKNADPQHIHCLPVFPKLTGNIIGIRSILNNFPFMVWAIDKNLDIVFWNSESEKLTGYLSSEVILNSNIFYKFFPDKYIRQKRIQQLADSHPMDERQAGIK